MSDAPGARPSGQVVGGAGPNDASSPFVTWLAKVSPALTDDTLRRKARLLAICLVSMTALFFCADVGLFLTVQNYEPPWYGYVLLVGTYWANRRGAYRIASALVVAMFPIVVFAQIISGTTANVFVSLAFLCPSAWLAAILLSTKGVAAVSLGNLLGILVVPYLAPSMLSVEQSVGPLFVTLMSGALAVVYMVHRDGLERHRQRELWSSEERLRMALDAAKLGTWDWYVSERRVIVSESLEQMFGLGPGEFGTSPEAYFARLHPDDASRVRARLDELLDGTGEEIHYTHRIVRPDRTARIIEFTGRVQRDKHGAATRMTGTGLDVSEPRALEERLRQAQKMEAVGRLAGGIAHDFNNMLTVISGNAELLRAHGASSEVEQIVKAASSAGNLTKQLLAYSRQAVLRAEVLNLNGVLLSTAEMLKRIIREDIQIEIATDPELWRTRADASQIQEILLNLATNARDAMPAGGRMVLRTQNYATSIDSGSGGPPTPGEYVLLSVSDTGEGMDEETQGRVFEPFFTTKPAGEGTGLGMAMVFGIVSQSGGHIHVESVEAHGTTFRIYFPRTHALPGPAPRPSLPPSGGSETVLLVEDEPAVRELCRRLLEEAGYRVLVAESAERARAISQSEVRIDMLLTDIVMPGTSGRALVSDLRGERPSLPVLFMSGYAQKTDAEPEAEPLEGDFLEKPFTREALLNQLRRTLSHARARRQSA